MHGMQSVSKSLDFRIMVVENLFIIFSTVEHEHTQKTYEPAIEGDESGCCNV